jgi:hypothetical protein
MLYSWSSILGKIGSIKCRATILHTGIGKSSSSKRTSYFTHVFEALDVKALSQLLASGVIRVNYEHCLVNAPSSSTKQHKYGLRY